METDALSLAQLTTVGGVAAFTALLTEVLWRTVAAAAAVKERFGPLVALGLGVVVAVGAGSVLGFGGTDLIQYGVNGVVGGLASMGIHDLLSSRPAG